MAAGSYDPRSGLPERGFVVRSRYEITVTFLLFRYGSLCRSCHESCNSYFIPTASSLLKRVKIIRRSSKGEWGMKRKCQQQGEKVFGPELFMASRFFQQRLGESLEIARGFPVAGIKPCRFLEFCQRVIIAQ